MKTAVLLAICTLSLTACHSHDQQQNQASVTVPLPPANAGNTADNVGENGETENNE